LHPGKKWAPKPLSSEQVKQTIALAALTFFKIHQRQISTLGKSILVKQKSLAGMTSHNLSPTPSHFPSTFDLAREGGSPQIPEKSP